jgi:hypothetical protein
MIETGVRTVMITTRTVPAPVPTTACRRSSTPAHRDFADPLRVIRVRQHFAFMLKDVLATRFPAANGGLPPDLSRMR